MTKRIRTLATAAALLLALAPLDAEAQRRGRVDDPVATAPRAPIVAGFKRLQQCCRPLFGDKAALVCNADDQGFCAFFGRLLDGQVAETDVGLAAWQA